MFDYDCTRSRPLTIHEYQSIHRIAEILGYTLKPNGVDTKYPYEIYCTSKDLKIMFTLANEK